MAPQAPAVGTTTAMSPAALHLYYENPREGDIPAIMASLRRHTQYKPITGNIGTHTGRPLEILAGNHTLMAFRELAELEPQDPQWHQILVHWVDVDDDMAERIMVADNQTGRLGGFDDAKLAEIVAGFDGDIDGLGFTEADVKMLSELADGPPDLDDLAKEHGEPQHGDDFEGIRLKLDPGVARQWADHRKGFDSDSEALEYLLDVSHE